MEEVEDLSFLGNDAELLSTVDLPPKSTPQTEILTLNRIFNREDITNNGAGVWSRAVLQLYNTMYDRINLARVSVINQEDVVTMQKENKRLKADVKKAEATLLRHAYNDPSESRSSADSQDRIQPRNC